MTNQKEIIIKGRAMYPGVTEGEALVSKLPMMGWGNVCVPMGYTVERGHPLYEVPLKGKILVFPYVRGSGGFVMYGGTKRYDKHPEAILVSQSMSVTVHTALTLKQPFMTDFDQDPVELIETGDYVYVNADEGYVKVIKKQPQP